MINRKGLRFVDEGEDTNMYTYAKFGAAILDEPGSKAYQIFDQKTVQHLEPRYETAKPLIADKFEDLDANNNELGSDDSSELWSESDNDILSCPKCTRKLRVPYDKRPAKARCPACETVFEARKK